MIKIKLNLLVSLVVCLSCKKNNVEPIEIVEPLEVVSAMKYSLEINNNWNSQSSAWPDQDAYFSWIGGATHNDNVKIWEVGTLASPEIDLMSITARRQI